MSQNQRELVQIAKGSMRIIWDAPIEMDDGTVLRADVFVPEKEGKYPVIITLGPYDLLSPRETKDFYDCIERAAQQPWCNGKVGINGIS